MDFAGTATPLGESDIVNEAQRLGVEPAAIWAVCDVESAGSGFLSDGRPKILFEAHSFHTLTAGRYDRSNPNISSPEWDRSLYGASGSHQYERLADAVELNREAGLESASWGRFQIMGSNFHACGYNAIEDYVTAMMASEFNHLDAFGKFCQGTGITRYLVSHDWSHFALRYNGPGQVPFYAQKLASAYERHLDKNVAPSSSSGSTPSTGVLKQGSQGAAVLALQQDLIKLGYSISADSDFGPGTEAAVIDFQTNKGLTADGEVGPMTMSAIAAAISAQP